MLNPKLPWAGNVFVIAGTLSISHDPILASVCFFAGNLPYILWSYRNKLWAVLWLNIVLGIINVGGMNG